VLSRELTRSDRAALAAATISRAARRCRPLLIGSAPSVTPTRRRAGDASFPRGHRFYWKAEFLRAIPDAAIEMLLECVPKKLGSSPMAPIHCPTSRAY